MGDDVNDIPMIRHAGLGIANGQTRCPRSRRVAIGSLRDRTKTDLVAVVEWLQED